MPDDPLDVLAVTLADGLGIPADDAAARTAIAEMLRIAYQDGICDAARIAQAAVESMLRLATPGPRP